MSHEATCAAWSYTRAHPEMDAHAVLILLALADRHNGLSGQLDPSLQRIATDCHCSVAKVKFVLRDLEARGLIERRSGGGSTRTRYQLVIPTPATTEPGYHVARSPRSQEGATTEPAPGYPVATNQERTRNEPAAAAQPFVPEFSTALGAQALDAYIDHREEVVRPTNVEGFRHKLATEEPSKWAAKVNAYIASHHDVTCDELLREVFKVGIKTAPASRVEYDPECPDCFGSGYVGIEGTMDTARCTCHALMIQRTDADVIPLRRTQ